MPKPILMPRLGLTVTDATLIEWRVKVGDALTKGDVVAVVAREGTSVDVRAPEAGIVLDLLHGAGGIVRATEPLLQVSEPAEPPILPSAAASSASATPAAAPTRLHRVRLRKGQGDPIVMLHGFGADHNAWRILTSGAAWSRPILAIDLPGHGRSPAGVTSLAAMADAVATTLADEGVAAADLVGHSLGAAVAVAVAEVAAFRVRSMFLVSPAGLGPDINGDFLAGFCRARSAAELSPWMALLVADPASLHPAFLQITAETRARPGVAEAQEQIARHLFPAGTQVYSVRQALERMAMPIRVVFGDADHIIPARHLAGLPGTIAQHLFPEVGHMPQVEARDAVARILLEHLRAAE